MIPDQPPPYGTIVFDCDSTLSSIEGIDELASAEPEAVAELTRLAMEGVVPLDEVYGKRLEMIQPTHAALERVSARYIEELVPGIREVFEVLHAAKKRLVIVSGGLLPAVAAVAAAAPAPPRARATRPRAHRRRSRTAAVAAARWAAASRDPSTRRSTGARTPPAR